MQISLTQVLKENIFKLAHKAKPTSLQYTGDTTKTRR